MTAHHQHPKFFLKTFFSQFVLCLKSNDSSSRNIGGRMHGPSPPRILGDRPPSLHLSQRKEFNAEHSARDIVACRLPETSTLLTYLILNRKRLVSGSDFPYLSVCRRSVAPCSGRDDVEAEALVLRLVADYVVKVPPCFTSTFCSVLAPWQSAQPSCVWWCWRWLVCSPQQSTACIVVFLLRLDFLFYLNALDNTPCY